MAIATCRLRSYALPLVRPWVAAKATIALRRGMLVAVTDGDGVTGWGDCAPLPSSGEAGHEHAFAALKAAATALPGRAVDAIEPEGIAAPEARWAVETALLDLTSRRLGLPLHCVFGSGNVKSVAVNAALGPLDPPCVARAKSAAAAGFAIAKIKVGIDSVEVERLRLCDLVAATDGRLRLRLDANRAWTEREAERFLGGIAHLPIDGVEEPLTSPSLAALTRLQRVVPFALAVDESVTEFGAAALFATRAVRRLVVKPGRIGGLAATMRLAGQARIAGIELVITSVVESVIGVTAAAHLAAALGGDATHGLATSSWLAEDVAPPPLISEGRLWLPEGAGLGIDPNGEAAQG